MRHDTRLQYAIVTIFTLAVLAVMGNGDAVAAESDDELFALRIQPVFARRCYKCHGPSVQEGGLRLDERDGALAELDSGQHAIVPSKTDDSEILLRLRSDDEGMRMPPEGKPLTDEEIGLIEQWIENGAGWAAHWSFRKPARREIPTPRDTSWIRTPIDAYILHELEAAEIRPAPPASKVSLLRRAYYDLTGLPPTPEQIDAYLTDESPDAFERVIDRLLESTHYGEKWARHWLDLVRYAETNGYERDSPKELIWKYRDYVIRAFNEDKPFNRFVLEQLAGDELADKDADSVTATGFYRLGLWDDEPVDRELARYDYLDDILRTTAESLLAMTIGCARCHDHKIDPIAQRDYYSMLAFFSDISPHGKGRANHVHVAKSADRQAYERRLAAKNEREVQLAAKIDAIEEQFLSKLRQRYPDVKLDDPAATALPSEVEIVLNDSQAEGQLWEYTFDRPSENWFAIAFDDRHWPKGEGGFGTPGTTQGTPRTRWDGRHIWLRRDFGLSEIPAKLTLRIHYRDVARVYLNGALVADLEEGTHAYQDVDITAEALEVVQTGRNTLAIYGRQHRGEHYIDAGLVADFRSPPTFVLARDYGAEILGDQGLDEWNRLRRELRKSRAEHFDLKTEVVMAVGETGHRKTWILGRGNPTMKGEEVAPAFPQILDPPEPAIESRESSSTSGKRLALAKWIASENNPMTARVIVNRIWQHHFGRGLARTPSDFGHQGLPPTHPELLDWLATEFAASGWRMKAMHKLIMMSSVYQMSSAYNDDAAIKDPTNNLFWRYDVRRLTAEEIRDSILFSSGTINLTPFGESVFPPLSAEVLATSSTPHRAWGSSSPEDAVRRSIYVHVKRSLRPPMLANFDAPDTDTPCAARVSTTVPTQALGMLNSRFMNEQAAEFAQRLRRDAPDDLRRQIATAIRIISARVATSGEIDDDAEFIADLRSGEQLSANEALRVYCLMLLNTNEFVYLD